MIAEWFKPRGYKHFDVPVGASFAESVLDASFVQRHSWSPLIHYVKEIKRYSKSDGKTRVKCRDIMYASHRDACILSKYAFELSAKLEERYAVTNLSDHVIGYRRLGKSNYDFSASALEFARHNTPCIIHCFDISGFFDNLNHSMLKASLRDILKQDELSADWYQVFQTVTRYRRVEHSDLRNHPKFGDRMKSRSARLIGTLRELKEEKISIHKNKNQFGIPQGTPISAVFANAYLLKLDQKVASECRSRNALYQRYSDDIIIICRDEDESVLTKTLEEQIDTHKLKLSDGKHERVVFDNTADDAIQYLGFDLSPQRASIRASSLARQWRKLHRKIRQTKRAGEVGLAAGKNEKIFTKKLRRRFSPIGIRNFSSYARRSANSFEDDTITKQVLRLERAADRFIRELNS